MKRTREGMRHIRHWRNRAASGNVYKGIVAGLLGGLIASWGMNQWLTLWQRLVTEDTAPRRGRLVAGQGGQLARHGHPRANLVLPDVMGSLLEFPSSAKTPLFQLYITGDTLVIDDLQEIPRRYPQIDLALLHLGGTRLLGILVTMDGKHGVQLMQMVAPQCSIPIHYNDYDVFTSPLTDFQQEVQATGLEERVHYLHHGDTYTFTVASTRAEQTVL